MVALGVGEFLLLSGLTVQTLNRGENPLRREILVDFS
jgi:hypothetical protein